MNIRKLIILFFTFIAIACIAGCYDSPSSGSNSPIGESETSIELNPSSSNTLILTNHLNVVTNFTISTTGSLSGLTFLPSTCSNVAPSHSCSVIFTTDTTASGTGSVIVTNSQGDTTTIPIALGTPSVSYSGTTISTTGENTVTITNNSDVTDTFTSLSLTAGSSNLSLSSTTCNASLTSGASCTVMITATADSAGTATLHLTGGNLNGTEIALNVAQPAIEFQNSSGTALASIHVDSNADVGPIYVKNLGIFNVQNIALSIAGSTSGVTKTTDGCSGSLAPGLTCSFELSGEANPTATGASIRASGTNLTDTDISMTAGDTVTIATVDPDSQSPAEAEARGLSKTELLLSNNLPNDQDIDVTSLSSSEPSSVDVITGNATYPDTCTGQTIANGGNCTFWIQAQSGTSLGSNTTPTLTANYTVGGIPATETVPLTVTTSLYVAGHFQLDDTAVSCLQPDGEVAPGGINDCNNLARFDGSNWYQVADSKFIGSSIILRDMILANDKLYMAGNFTNLDVSPDNSGDNANYLANWDGFMATSVGTSGAPFTALSAAVFNKPYNSTYSNVNMLAFDGTNDRLFFNRIVASRETPVIYSSDLEDHSLTWTRIAYAGSNAGTTSSNMTYDTNTSTLYVTGPSNQISASGSVPATRELIWYWNGTAWTGFTPTGVTPTGITLSSLFIHSGTLYDYYGTAAGNFLCTSAGDISEPNCNAPESPTTLAGGNYLYHAGLTGFNPNNDSLVVVGSAVASPAPMAAIREIPTATLIPANTTGNQIQLIFNAINLGDSQYISGTFNSFNNVNHLACLAHIADDGTVSAVTGLTPASCNDASNIPTNNVVYKLLVVSSVTLSS